MLSVWGAAAAAAATRPELRSAYEAGLTAYVHGYPPVVNRLSQQTFPTNTLIGIAATSTPANRLVVLPNVDTAYSVARLDLRHGPLVIHVPAMQGRYYTLQLLDAYTNVFGYIGTRVTGSRPGSFLLVGPGSHQRTPGMRTIRSPTDDVLVLGRTLVERTDDTASLHDVLSRFTLTPLSVLTAGGQPIASAVLDKNPGRPAPRLPRGLAFLDAFDQILVDDPPTAAERHALAPLARFGVGPGLQGSATRLPADVRSALLRGLLDGPAHLDHLARRQQQLSRNGHAGWSLPNPRTGAAGSDWTLRAVVARLGLWSNTPPEAIYPTAAVDSAGRRLSGHHRYVLTFSSPPPAKAFWSLTMYDAQLHLYANRLDRYAIGDRTPGLNVRPGRPLTLYLQHATPSRHRAAWLPAPAGHFVVTLRLYIPAPTALRGRWRPPGIRCLDCQ